MKPSKLGTIKKDQADKALTSTRHLEGLAHIDNVSQSVLSATSSLIQYLEGRTTKAEIVNQLQSIATPDIEHVVKAVEILDQTIKNTPQTDLSGLTSLMQELVAEAKAIPKDQQTVNIPQPVDNTKQLTSLLDAVKAVEKVVKAQKLIAEAPVVNVPETSVHVDAPDLKPLQSGFKDVVAAVKGIVISEFKTDNAAVEKLLRDANKTLDKLLKKPISSGGGGGSSWTAIGTNGLPAPLNLDGSGNLKITGGGGGGGTDAQYTDGDATITHPIGTIPVFDKAGIITAVSDTNPLPTSATVSLTNYASETGGNLASIKTNTDKLDVALSTRLKPADTLTKVATIDTITNVVHIDDNSGSVTVDGTFFQATQPVSAAALPLPSGAATSSAQGTGNASAASIDAKLSGILTVDDIGPTSIVAFVTSVGTAGTRVQLAGNAVEAGVLQAPSTNAGIIYVGGSNVSSTVYGAELQPGQATGLAIDNTNKIYIDSSVNGDKCSFLGG